MLYTYKTIEAMKLAESVYHERYDKIGCPYIAHPLWVAEQVSQVYSGSPDQEEAVCVALLHDVVEDCCKNWEERACFLDFIEAIWGRSVAHAVEAISRSDEEPYMTYIERLSRNPIATQVKIQDLKHNMLPERNLTVSGMVSLDFRSLRKRYEKALAYLTKKTGG